MAFGNPGLPPVDQMPARNRPRFPLEDVPAEPQIAQVQPPDAPSALPGALGLALDAAAGGDAQQLVLKAIERTQDDYRQRRIITQQQEARRLELQFQQGADARRFAQERNADRQKSEVIADQADRQVANQERDTESADRLRQIQGRVEELRNQREVIEAQAKAGLIDAQTAAALAEANERRANAVRDIAETYQELHGARKGYGVPGGGTTGAAGGTADTGGAGTAGGVKFGALSGTISQSDPEGMRLNDLNFQRDAAQRAVDDPLATPEAKAQALATVAGLTQQIDTFTQDTLRRRAANLAAAQGQAFYAGSGAPGGFDFKDVDTFANAYFDNDQDRAAFKALIPTLPDPTAGAGKQAAAYANLAAFDQLHPGTKDVVSQAYVDTVGDIKAEQGEDRTAAMDQAADAWSSMEHNNTPVQDLPYFEDVVRRQKTKPAIAGTPGQAPAGGPNPDVLAPSEKQEYLTLQANAQNFGGVTNLSEQKQTRLRELQLKIQRYGNRQQIREQQGQKPHVYTVELRK